MKNILSIILLIASSYCVRAQNIKEVDICVYGGTSAGVIAAYTAALQGKSVLLVSPGTHLGGLSSGGLGYTDIGNKYAVTGLARDFYRRVGTHYGKLEQWIFEPHVAEEIFRSYIKQGNVPVLYNFRITGVTKSETSIKEIVVEHSISPSTFSNQLIRAKVFIDCTYEGDLMAKAGVSYFIGREANSQFNEDYNGVQLLTHHQFADGIDPYKIKGRPESGLLWGISSDTLAARGSGDNKVQAYNFRICLTRDPANRIIITEPENYDSNRYELLIRVIEKDPKISFNRILKPDLMPNQKTDINNNGPFSTDMIGMNYDYPEADYRRRMEIIKQHEDYTKGLLYFIGHSGRVPKHLRDEMLQWGYPRDEYVENNNWSPQLYVREARRMMGEYVMTQANCQGKERVNDGVGMAAYTMDSHNTQRLVVNGMVKNEGDVQIGGFPPYPISYRSLVPKYTECSNLLVPVCLSATHIAYGSIRMEPVFMVLSQSSAVAASMAIDKKIAVQQIDVNALQNKLKTDPLADGSVSEITIDNDDQQSVKMLGDWTIQKNARGCYGLSLLTADPAKTVSSVRYTPTILQNGEYEIFMFVAKMVDVSSRIHVTVYNGKQHSRLMPVRDIKVEGQTSGEWISIGRYFLKKGTHNYLEISTKDADGKVVADAVLFLPTRRLNGAN